MPLIEALQRSEEWFRAREGKLTASIAAGCLGLDPYCSRQKAWRTILGTQKKDENGFMQWGNAHESDAIAEYEVQSGNLVLTTGFWIHPYLTWLGGSPDGLVGSDGLLEVKCPQTLPVKVPIAHRIQMLVQLHVTERKWADYFAWVPGGHFLERVQRLDGLGLLVALSRFYDAYVVANVQPPRKRRKQ